MSLERAGGPRTEERAPRGHHSCERLRGAERSEAK